MPDKLILDAEYSLETKNGFLQVGVSDGEIMFAQTIKTTLGWLQLPGTSIVSSGSDGTNTWFTMRIEHMEPLLLKYENEDMLCFTVSDDLSTLKHFRITAGCKKEIRE